MSSTVPAYPEIRDDSDSHNEVKNEMVEDSKIKLDEKILNLKCELIELMKKQLDTINLLISLK